MSWFQSTNLATFAKTALKEAQKTIDKALEINEENASSTSATTVATVTEAASDFFSSWGVGPKNSRTKKDDESRASPVPPPLSLNEMDGDGSSDCVAKGRNGSSNSNRQPHHKRSASLELTEAPQLGALSHSMHKSLTSDIPVTLIVPNPSLNGLTPAHEFLHSEPTIHQESLPTTQHSRSLSDTVFNSTNFLDDFDGTVQVLDSDVNTESHQILSSKTNDAAHSTTTLKLQLKTQQISSSKTKVNDGLKDETDSTFVNVTTSNIKKLVKTASVINETIPSLDTLSTVDLGLIPLDALEPDTLNPTDSSLIEEEKTLRQTLPIIQKPESECLNSEFPVEGDKEFGLRALDESSVCDNSWSWTEPEPHPNQSSISSWEHISTTETAETSVPVAGRTDADVVLESVEDNKSELVKPETQPDPFVEPEPLDNIKSILESHLCQSQSETKDLPPLVHSIEEAPFDAVHSEPEIPLELPSSMPGDLTPEAELSKSSTLSPLDVQDSKAGAQQVLKVSQPEVITATDDSGIAMDALDADTDCKSSADNYRDRSKFRVGDQGFQEEVLLREKEWINQTSSSRSRSPPLDSQDNWPLNDCNPSTSPLPIESPPSFNSPINYPEESRMESPNSPNQLDRLSNTKSPDVIQDMSLAFATQREPMELPESSRSSSIVVVSGRNSTPSGSAASTGSSASEGHPDMEDHSHPTPLSNKSEGQEHHCDPVPSFKGPGKSYKFIKGGKGQFSSASSSSDIEVIPSDFSTGSKSGVGESEISARTESTETRSQQTSPTPHSIDAESQTDGDSSVQPAPVPPRTEVGTSELIREKDEMISELRAEGEKLSKKQFEMSQMVKKVRGKEKELEMTIKLLKGELAGKSLENERLMKSYVSKQSAEHTQNENMQKLTLEKRSLELKIQQMKSELEDANENCASMKASLEDASIEMLELKNAISSCQRDSGEMDSLIREKCELISKNELLQKEVENLRSTLNSTQSKGSSRETELKSQITTLRGKVHSLENELSDISSDVADATMPLSLEIEKLQVEVKNLTLQHAKREQALQSVITDLKSKLQTGFEKEKDQKEHQSSLQAKVSSLEEKIELLEAENKKLVQNLRLRDDKERSGMEERNTKVTKLETELIRLHTEIQRLCDENETLGSELKLEKNVAESEKRKSQSLMDQMSSNSSRNTLNSQLNQNNFSVGGTTGNSISVNNNGGPKSGENSPGSHSILSETSYLDEVFDPHGVGSGTHRSITPKSFFDSFSSVGLIENLQSQLRQRETEVTQLQDQIHKTERIRRTLNEEIAKLTMQNQEFQIQMERLTHFQNRLEKMEKDNNALLQMYGEKVEEADELRLDLQDVKDMYKTQIEQLLKK